MFGCALCCFPPAQLCHDVKPGGGIMFLTVVIGCKYFVKMNSDIGANIRFETFFISS